MLLYLLAFFASAVFIFLASVVLTRSADAIAEATGLGRAWIGAVLLAAATSLPELATDVSAVRMNAPNLAAGDLFGSSLVNMLILAVVDQLSREVGVLRSAAVENALSACLAIILNTLGALFVLVQWRTTLFGVSPQSALLLLVYLGGTRAVYRSGVRHAQAPAAALAGCGKKDLRRLLPLSYLSQRERRLRKEAIFYAGRGTTKWAVAWKTSFFRTLLTRERRIASPAIRQAVALFAGGATVILAVSPVLAWSAKHIAEATGLGSTFVGTWLLGLSTSLPEFATSFAAVRIGAFDLAVGNLFGSNAFNMVIFVALDLASPNGSFFARLSQAHAISGTLAVILMSLGLAGILYRAERRFIMVEPDSALMLVAYVLSIWIMYSLSAPG